MAVAVLEHLGRGDRVELGRAFLEGRLLFDGRTLQVGARIDLRGATWGVVSRAVRMARTTAMPPAHDPTDRGWAPRIRAAPERRREFAIIVSLGDVTLRSEASMRPIIPQAPGQDVRQAP